MAQDVTLTEEDIKKLAQRGGMELGDQQNFWEWYQNTLSAIGAVSTPATIEGDTATELEAIVIALLAALDAAGIIVDETT